MHKLTNRQTEVLELLNSHMQDKGAPPTRAEIAQIMGFKSPNAAEDHLRALAKKGMIELIPGTSRGIKIINAKNDGIPIIGNVAAGQPILAEEHISSTYSVHREAFSPKADYLLKVKGNSMQKAGILDGDLLVVHVTKEAKNGQIIVARIENEVTVKRFKKENNKIYLIPENDDFHTIEIDLYHQEFAIEGIAVGVIRAKI